MDKIRRKNAQKVVVAMSGGLDSSVAAALLKKEGFEVIGVFMKLADLPNFKKSEKRAKKIAKILNIPFITLNFKKEFKKKIVDHFLDGYKKGITPNPCVICNKEIKFGLLLKKALKLDVDFIATGHYARTNLFKNFALPSNSEGGRRKQAFFALVKNLKKIKLMKGKDKNKDQSYFLWQLNQEQLKKVLFPVGNYTKSQVRNLAKKFKLPVLNIPESMEICFIPDKLEDFLKRYIKTKPGPILAIDGKKIGHHPGLPFYTIGQRKGIELSGGPAFAKASAGKPYYVVKKDKKKNTLIVVSILKDESLWSRTLTAKNVNWILGKEPKLPLKIKAQIRYGQEPVSAVIANSLRPKVYNLKFKIAQRAVTPGQSIVFYRGQELLGGGIIC